MPPITFTQINSIPDILSTDRFTLMFPTIQGVDGRALTLRHAEVSIPKRAVAQIGVKYLGHSAYFRGNSENDSIMNVQFFEDAEGTTTDAIFAWMKLVRNSEDGSGLLKEQYAQQAAMEVYNTVGEPALTFDLYNIWPMSVTFPEFGEQSGPAKITVEFSVDGVTPNGLEGDGTPPPGGGSYGRSYTTRIGGSIGVGASVSLGGFNLSVTGSVPLPVNALTLSQFANKFSRFF